MFGLLRPSFVILEGRHRGQGAQRVLEPLPARDRVLHRLPGRGRDGASAHLRRVRGLRQRLGLGGGADLADEALQMRAHLPGQVLASGQRKAPLTAQVSLGYFRFTLVMSVSTQP